MSAKLCGVEQRVPPTLGRAAMTLGTGTHSSFHSITQIFLVQKFAFRVLSDELLAWLSVWSDVHLISIWSSRCHYHPIISCFIKIQNCFTFLVSAYPGCAGKVAIKWVSLCLLLVQKYLFIAITRYHILYLNKLLEEYFYLCVESSSSNNSANEGVH